MLIIPVNGENILASLCYCNDSHYMTAYKLHELVLVGKRYIQILGRQNRYRTLVKIEMSKGSIEIVLPKYYTFINDTSRGCIYILSL